MRQNRIATAGSLQRIDRPRRVEQGTTDVPRHLARDIVGSSGKSVIETLINEIGVSYSALRVDRAKNEIE